MTTAVEHREFIPGTTGWTADDLDDPEIEHLWMQGRYEIVEGVLTMMAPAYYDGNLAVKRLIRLIDDYTIPRKLGDGCTHEVDLILNKRRVGVVDAVFLTPQDQEKQRRAHAATGKRKQLRYGRILIVPTLIIESISRGHEAHDRETKRRWYAEAGVPNYWMLDALERSLECLILEGADYRVDQSGKDAAELRPAMFPGLVIQLGKIWAE